MVTFSTKESLSYGVHSEVGQLRKVMFCAPGLAHTRLTPTNCDGLLFDDVMWVDNARRDHFDFVTKMRDRGVEVAEMRDLLAETRLPASSCEMKVRSHLCCGKQATEIKLQLGGELSLRFLPLMSSLGSSLGGAPLREKAPYYSILWRFTR
jgi:arginine deiminase-like protein